MTKKTLISIIAVLLIAGLIYWAVNNKQDTTESTTSLSSETATVTVRDITESIKILGEVKPLLQTEIKSEVSGRIETIHITNGQTVEKDQLLIKLERQSLLNDLKEAERNVDAFRLRLEKAERHFKRLTELRERDFAQQAEYEDAETELKLARIELEIREARLETKREDLDDTIIRAPHEGIVLDLDLNEGQVIVGATSVNNGTVLMRIADLTQLYVATDLNEVDIERIKLNQSAKITFDAIQDIEYPGIITEIAPGAIWKNNLRVFPLEIVFEAKEATIRPGITANIEIPLSQKKQVNSVILSAVFTNDRGDEYVYKQTSPDNWEKTTVKTGISDLLYVEILEGLKPGDIVRTTRPAGQN